MAVKFLSESLKIQKGPALKTLEKLILPAKKYLHMSRFLLGDLTDENPGIFSVSGKDEDFTKIIMFTAQGKVSAGLYKENILYILGYISYSTGGFKNPKTTPELALIAETFSKDPNYIRNLLVRISKGSFVNIVRNINKTENLYWEQQYRFFKLQKELGNLPLEFK